MRRRDVITLLGGVAAWPLAAHAQQPARPVVGFLSVLSPGPFAPFVAAFRAGLKEGGFVEGQNVAIEYRWAEGQSDKLPGLAADLVRRPVAVIATAGGIVTANAAKAATSTIPIVFGAADDPVASGLVASLNRPGGNITGVNWLGGGLRAKNLELLAELVPNAATFAVLFNPKNPNIDSQLKNTQEAASTLGRKLEVVTASSSGEIDAAFAAVVQAKASGLIVATDPLFADQRDRIVALAARHAVPAVYFLRAFVAAGGLMSYGSSLADAFRLVGGYTARVLKGDKPANLPVQQSTKVELVINLKAAKALGVTFPNTLLGRADEVIE